MSIKKDYIITVKFKIKGRKSLIDALAHFQFILGRWCGVSKALFKDDNNVVLLNTTAEELAELTTELSVAK